MPSIVQGYESTFYPSPKFNEALKGFYGKTELGSSSKSGNYNVNLINSGTGISGYEFTSTKNYRQLPGSLSDNSGGVGFKFGYGDYIELF